MGLLSSLLSKPSEWLIKYLGDGALAADTISFDRSMKVPAFRAGVEGIAATISSLPSEVQIFTADKWERSSDEMTQRVLTQRPNNYQNAQQFWAGVLSNLVPYGDAYAMIERQSGRMTALHILPSKFVEPEEYEPRKFRYLYSGANSQTKYFYEDEILHFRTFSEDGVVGRSILSDGAKILWGAFKQIEYNTNFWHNGGQPKGILSLGGTIKDADRRREIQSQFNDNSGNVAVLSEGAKYQPISANMNESAYGDISRDYVQQIARLLRVPTPKLYEYMGLNGAGSMEEIDVQYLKDCISPIVSMIEQEVFVKILKDDFRYKIDTASVVRAAMQQRVSRLVSLINAGVMTPNEARKEENLPPVSDNGADELHIPQNLAPIGDVNNGNINRASDE